MEFEITCDRKNELLGRRELEFTLTYSGATPSRQQVQSKLAALQSVKETLLVVEKISSEFGKMEIRGIARIYGTEEQKKAIERPYLVARGAPKPKEGGEAKEGAGA